MKLMRTIRFDSSDAQVFTQAAGSDEWAVPGGFTFAALAEAEVTGKLRQAFRNGFWSITSQGYSTFVAVAEIDPMEHSRLVSQLADHLVAAYGAPSLNAAIEAAASEIEFATDLCADLPINSLLTVKREQGGEFTKIQIFK